MKTIISTVLLLGISIILQAQEEKVYKNLEEALKSPEEVYQLDLSGQQLTSVPKGFKKFENLKRLNLSNNSFTKLPNFGDFTELEWCDLSNNKIDDIPAFIRMKGESKNLIIENNPVVKIVPATSNEVLITEPSYEGTIKLTSEGSYEFVKGNEGNFVRIYLDAKKKYWMEIHLKEGKTNDDILKPILSSKDDPFNYFINKNSTFDVRKGDLPAHFMYNYSNARGKVWISSNSFLVVFEKYYITLKTSEKYISLYDTKKYLETAITYKPKEDGYSIVFSEEKMDKIDAETFLKKAKPPEIKSIASKLPELVPVKEIIYTMKPGETVAFTNEYQLGVQLKEAEYYIYIKKGGKYYIHTAEKTFGPYDDLPSANPNNPNGDDLIRGFKTTKGDKNFIISEGKELGPFSKQSYFYSYKGLNYIKETENKLQYIVIDNKRMGPFTSWPSAYKINEGYIVYGKNKDQKYDLYLNGELKESNIERKGWSFTDNDELVYDFIKEGQTYVWYKNESIGGYDEVSRLAIKENKLTFHYKKDGKTFLYLDGKRFGPYDYLETPYYLSQSEGFIYKEGSSYFIQIINGAKEGPFDAKPKFLYGTKKGNYIISVGEKGNKEFIYKGKKHGPFKDVYEVNSSFSKHANSDDKLPILMVRNSDLSFSIYFKDKILGPFDNEPEFMIDTVSQNYVINVRQKNSSGNMEYFLITDKTKTGPFKKVSSNCQSYAYNANFCHISYTIEDLNGQLYLMENNNLYGPFDELTNTYGQSAKGFLKKIKLNGEYYFLDNDGAYGPIQLSIKTEESDKINISFEEGNFFAKNWKNKETPCLINNIPFGTIYNYVGSNDRNYVADTYSVTDARFVINNKEYLKGILNHSWDEESKTFYWLSLEGKNIIRNKVKL